MPIRLELDRSAGVTRTTVEGAFSLSDLRRHVAVTLDRKAYQYPGLIDARNAEALVWRPRDLLTMARLVTDGLGRRQVAPCAVVVSSDSHFAQARAVASYVAGWMRLAIFEDLAAAEQWIGDASTAMAMAPTLGTESARESLDRGRDG